MAFCADKPSPILNLSNNALYSIVACDSEAETYITALARLMKLQESGCMGRNVLVYVNNKDKYEPRIILPENDQSPIPCSLLSTDDPDLFFLQVGKIARTIAADVTSRGGALIHGGLCSYKDLGAVIAGHGGIGKTTASNRLPAPWISHSDDATLLIPSDAGGYNAHPWPTWSRFFCSGPGGAWAVEKAVPLVAIFYLERSGTESLKPIGKIAAKVILIDHIEQSMNYNKNTDQDKYDLIKGYVNSADKISSAVPAYRLGLSLEGEFWREMERVMPDPEDFRKQKNDGIYLGGKYRTADNQEELNALYRGSSMKPTLFEPEILTIKPYGNKNPKKGDIICYRVDGENKIIVHRVIAVKGSSIKTKGDNLSQADDYLVDKDAVIGRVTSSRKNNVTKTIYSGYPGIVMMYLRQCSDQVIAIASKLMRKSYYSLATSGFLRPLKPKKMVFKVVVFDRLIRSYPKLILNGRTVGTFNFKTMAWQIKKPYRLFIDENELPLIEDPL